MGVGLYNCINDHQKDYQKQHLSGIHLKEEKGRLEETMKLTSLREGNVVKLETQDKMAAMAQKRGKWHNINLV